MSVVDIRFGKRDCDDHLFIRIGDEWPGDQNFGLIVGHVSNHVIFTQWEEFAGGIHNIWQIIIVPKGFRASGLRVEKGRAPGSRAAGLQDKFFGALWLHNICSRDQCKNGPGPGRGNLAPFSNLTSLFENKNNGQTIKTMAPRPKTIELQPTKIE